MWNDGLLIEKPMGWAISPSNLSKYCSFCLKPSLSSKLNKCSACKTVHYCNRDCQQADWDMHKMECKYCKASGCAGDESYRLVLRLAKKLDMGDDGSAVGGRRFEDLMDHRDKMKSIYREWRCGYDKWIGSLPNKAKLSDDLIESIICKVFINSFGLTSVFGATIGIALCVQLSGLDHSCQPSARIAFKGNECRIVPIKPCSEGAILTHSYIDELLPLEERRKQLMESYKFECHCDGCANESRNMQMTAFACEACKGPIKLNGKCEDCKNSMTSEHASTCEMADKMAQASLQALAKCPSASSKSALCKKSLELVDDVLYSFNVRRLALLRHTYESCVALSEFSEAISYGAQILEVLNHYDHPNDLAVIHLKFNLAKIYFKNGQAEICANYMREVEPQLDRIYGKESAIYHELLLTLNTLIKS